MPKGKKAGRVRDKWRDKKWVIVQPPATFGSQPIGYIPVSDEEKAIGRVIECTLFDIWKTDPQQHTIKLYFQIERIDGNIAHSKFKGHEYAKEFLRSLIRRGSSIVNHVNDYTTSDGYKFRISTIAFTQRRVNTSKKQMIRRIITEVLTNEISKLTLDQFVQGVVGPKFNADLHSQTKKIIGVRHIAVRKTKLLTKSEPKKLEVEAPTQ
ncbi:MAG: 30S ribosomal protein S3ae [Nitrososphaerales archaeon]